jgi:hypothetical protein
MSEGMVRCQGQRLCGGGLCRSKMFYPIVGQIAGANCSINQRYAGQRLNISRLERQGPVKKAACLRQLFRGSALIDPSGALGARRLRHRY